MIRLDLMDRYKSNNLIHKTFYNHRDGVDPLNYRVGKSEDGKPIILNPDNNKIMDYYFDDLDEYWIDLSVINPEFTGYKISRIGQVVGPRKDLKISHDACGYPKIKIKGKYYNLHRILSLTFIPNLDHNTYNVVDHIDRNKENYSLSNLRWCSMKENSNNVTWKKFMGNLKYNQYKDKERKILVKTFSDIEFYNKYPDRKYKSRVSNSVSKNTRFDGYYWDIVDLDLESYLNRFNIVTVDGSLWRLHYSKKYYVHPTGLVRYRRKRAMTVGSLSADPKYRAERRLYDGNRVHTAVAEVFLNNNSPINKGKVIDHINTDPSDNRVTNLRICTQKVNMRNPETIKKLSRKVMDRDGRIFNSITECANFYKVAMTCIWNRLNGRRPSRGFKYVQ